MITLYHGSNVDIPEIDLRLSKKGKDFGCGFYLNANKEQAWNMAERTTLRLQTGKPILNAYLFDEQLLEDDRNLNVKKFDDYSVEWVQFVLMNRNNRSDKQAHSLKRITYEP